MNAAAHAFRPNGTAHITQVNVAASGDCTQIASTFANLNAATPGLNVCTMRRTDVNFTTADFDPALAADVLEVDDAASNVQKDVGSQRATIHVSPATFNFHRPGKVIQPD
jgi:hypothetical protein